MKKGIHKTILFAAALMAPAILANAAVSQGTWELGFTGSYSSLDAAGTDIDTLIVDANGGYFVTNNIQISGSVSYLDTEIEDMGLDALMLGAGIDYHFMPRSEFVPFVGGSIRWVDVDVDGLGGDDDFAWEIRGGAKQFLARNVAIKYQVSYLEFDDLDLDGIIVSVGLSFFF